MARNFKTQLAGQIGESVVVAELGRRGIIATAFAGNVPDIDVVGYKDGKTIHLQVKTWRSGEVSFDAKRFIEISLEGNKQTIHGLDETLDGELVYVFVRIGEAASNDRFFILLQKDLQKLIFDGYTAWLAKHNGVRPRNPNTTHTAVSLDMIAQYENNWALIEEHLE